MRSNKIMRIIVFVFVIAILAVTITSLRTTQGQQQEKAKKRIRDEGHIPVVDYDELDPQDPEKREKRKLKNSRFDKGGLVIKNPSSRSAGSSVSDESFLPPIPTIQSSTIIIGEVISGEAHMSNDKGYVYSEYAVRVQEVLKSNASNNPTQGSLITVERIGGFVRYPHGQKLLYRIAGKGYPRPGQRHVLFLENIEQNTDYKILTGYELRAGRVFPIDLSSEYQRFRGMNEVDFIATIREVLTQGK